MSSTSKTPGMLTDPLKLTTTMKKPSKALYFTRCHLQPLTIASNRCSCHISQQLHATSTTLHFCLIKLLPTDLNIIHIIKKEKSSVAAVFG